MVRNNLSESEAIARIKNQLPLEEKIAKADVVLDNNCQDVRILYQQIDSRMGRGGEQYSTSHITLST